MGEIDRGGRELAVYCTDFHSVELYSTEDRHLFHLEVSSGGFCNWSGRVWALDSRVDSLEEELEMSIQSQHWGLYAVYSGDFESVSIENGQVIKREERKMSSVQKEAISWFKGRESDCLRRRVYEALSNADASGIGF
jgi:hypothetical protein